MDIYKITKAGLSNDTAKQLLKKHGRNSVSDSQAGIFWILFRSISSPMTLLLVMAAGLSFLSGAVLEPIIMCLIVLINTTLGSVQEIKSIRAVKHLSQMMLSTVTVWRDGIKAQLNPELLVPGDIILLESGALVPADAIIIFNDNSFFDESSLTGESIPVLKEQKNSSIFSGTYLKSGSVIARITKTGEESSLGKLNRLSHRSRHLTEYEKNLHKLAKDISIVALLATGIVFVLHSIFNPGQPVNILLTFTLAIALSLIPEALPAIASLALSHSALKLTKKQVIVKELGAIETLGNADLICTDKTGTLTENRLKLVKLDTNPEYKDRILHFMFQTSVESDDPFDVAISEHLEISGYENKRPLLKYIEKSFDPFKKYSSRDFDHYELVKGAPEMLQQEAGMSLTEIREIESRSAKGYRVLGLALKHKNQIKYLATMYFYDPIKPEVETTLKLAEEQGIGIKIITGDSLEISRFVANQVGILDNPEAIITASELMYDEPKILEQQVRNYSVFCRADPIQKYKIIEALQANFTVAYLGDGINDAPSLLLADVGIVVNSASDMSKNHADLVLTKKDLKVLVTGIIEGRKAFERIEKYLMHNLSSNFGNMLSIAILSLFVDYLPMLPIQIIITNLLIDMTTLEFAFDKVDKKSIKKPVHRSFSSIIKVSLVLGLQTTILDLIFFAWAKSLAPGQVQTLWFVVSGLAELLAIFSIRTHGHFWKSAPKLSFLVIAILTGFLFLLFGLLRIPGLDIYPLDITFIPAIIILPLVYLGVYELLKINFIKRFKL